MKNALIIFWTFLFGHFVYAQNSDMYQKIIPSFEKMKLKEYSAYQQIGIDGKSNDTILVQFYKFDSIGSVKKYNSILNTEKNTFATSWSTSTKYKNDTLIWEKFDILDNKITRSKKTSFWQNGNPKMTTQYGENNRIVSKTNFNRNGKKKNVRILSFKESYSYRLNGELKMIVFSLNNKITKTQTFSFVDNQLFSVIIENYGQRKQLNIYRYHDEKIAKIETTIPKSIHAKYEFDTIDHLINKFDKDGNLIEVEINWLGKFNRNLVSKNSFITMNKGDKSKYLLFYNEKELLSEIHEYHNGELDYLTKYIYEP